MELRDYLHQYRVTCASMAKELGIGANYMRTIKRKQVKPSRNLSEQIQIITGGKVTVADLRGEDEE